MKMMSAILLFYTLFYYNLNIFYYFYSKLETGIFVCLAPANLSHAKLARELLEFVVFLCGI